MTSYFLVPIQKVVVGGHLMDHLYRNNTSSSNIYILYYYLKEAFSQSSMFSVDLIMIMLIIPQLHNS